MGEWPFLFFEDADLCRRCGAMIAEGFHIPVRLVSFANRIYDALVYRQEVSRSFGRKLRRN